MESEIHLGDQILQEYIKGSSKDDIFEKLHIDDYIYSDEVVNIPVSSEYISTTELFSIENDSLNNLWKKNPSNIKWGFENSISSYDYPYMINLNTNSEDYNRTCSLDNYFPDNMDRNLDYFYTLLRNDSILNYDFQSLNINDTFSIKYLFT